METGRHYEMEANVDKPKVVEGKAAAINVGKFRSLVTKDSYCAKVIGSRIATAKSDFTKKRSLLIKPIWLGVEEGAEQILHSEHCSFSKEKKENKYSYFKSGAEKGQKSGETWYQMKMFEEK